MPKCEVDLVLKDRVHRFISTNRVTINGAAAKLGLNRTTFWRFCDTGRASSKTKLQIHNALEKRNKNLDEDVSLDSASVSNAPVNRTPTLPRFLADRELKQIRRACEGVLALIEVYEAQHAGQKILNPFQSDD